MVVIDPVAAAATVMVKAFDVAVSPPASVARTCKLPKVPDADGVPLITPAVETVIPEGHDPTAVKVKLDSASLNIDETLTELIAEPCVAEMLAIVPLNVGAVFAALDV